MINKEFDIDKESYLHRLDLLKFYNTPEGVKELCSWILMGGVLSEISRDSQVIAHNMVIRKLEEIGLLDEDGLEDLVKYLLTKGSYKRPNSEEN